MVKEFYLWAQNYGFYKVCCENSVNNKSGSRSKHINIKYLAIRERIRDKIVVIEHVSTELMIADLLFIEHVSTELMIADLLTKGMPPLKFKDHVKRMRLGPLV